MPRDFSYRKFKRKAENVGYRSATISAAELLSRKIVVSPAVNWLCDRGVFTILSQSELRTIADQFVNVTNESVEYGNMTAPFVADIGTGYIFTGTGLSATDDMQIVNQSLFPPGHGRRFVVAKIIWQLFFQPTYLTTALAHYSGHSLDGDATFIEAATPLIPRYSDNYYHWVIETLPKIRYVREFESKTGVDITYLVPGDTPSWLNETLELLGVPEEKIEYATNHIYKTDQLVLPSFPVQTKADYSWIAEMVLKNINPDQSQIEVGSNIYISRSKAIERRVVNEKEVMNTLSKYSFEQYHLEDQTVAENAALFHQADVIVGAHGAGLTDIIYCDDATVIELFGSKVKDPYEQLAQTMDLRYESVKCTATSTDMSVDTDLLADVIENHI